MIFKKKKNDNQILKRCLNGRTLLEYLNQVLLVDRCYDVLFVINSKIQPI